MIPLGVYFAMYSGTMDAIVYDTVLEETGSSDGFERRLGRVRFVESVTLVASALAGGVIANSTSTRLTYFLTVPFGALAVDRRAAALPGTAAAQGERGPISLRAPDRPDLPHDHARRGTCCRSSRSPC